MKTAKLVGLGWHSEHWKPEWFPLAIREPDVIELALIPARVGGIVALGAVGGEAGGLVVGVGGPIVVVLVAGVAVGGRPLVGSPGVAGLAGDRRVAAGERPPLACPEVPPSQPLVRWHCVQSVG